MADGALASTFPTMRFAFSAAQIADLVQASRMRGATTDMISGVASLNRATAGDLSFLGNPRYRSDVAKSEASVILISPGLGLSWKGSDRGRRLLAAARGHCCS